MNHAIDTYINKIIEALDSYPKNIPMACCNIINKIYEHDVAEVNHLTFGRLYDWAGIDNYDEFNTALYLLVDPKFNVLVQHFEAFNVRKCRYEGLENDFIHDVLTTGEYVDPFTFESITEEKFNSLVSIFFSPSFEFRRNLCA
ncbi:TPA: hypothetical protein ACSIR4_001179 [Acinetobacter baumannii]|uniref:hypothetical protein n=1 Tax=Acinetobacter baumannii TaxID=470 RepID=UPI0010C7F905|nr:hypothetical protein [Acinetobacter baumannii]NDW80559.1 hypothetical protein [Acinetobacter baumannii]NDW95690.1 hypothetical protein [Acinetobacter baumannii]QCP24076.1 hypothetical protein FDF35_11015 [Acinetobacter baumannii]